MTVAQGAVLTLFFLTADSALPQQAPPAQEAAPLPKYLEVTPRIGTGGQPTESGMRLLAEKGYTSIINLRTSAEMAPLAYEEKIAGETGLKYFALPVAGAAPREAQALAFLQLMKMMRKEKVFVHCTAANRAGAFMMIYLGLQKKMDLQKADAEAVRIGMRSENLRQFAREMIAKQKAK